ncbi:MAG: gluconeogenesis factor YvcK family protein, partial [Armatimonadota bacterium]
MRRRIWFRGWFRPTAQLYRHIGLASLSLVIFVTGVVISFRNQLRPIVDDVALTWTTWLKPLMRDSDPESAAHLFGLLLLLLGGVGIYQGVRGFVSKLAGQEDGKAGAITDYLRKQHLANGPRVVAIGGGSGLSTLLRGLKQYTSNITAVVTVTDDGGSSGRLVADMGIIPPGDIRNCLVALADAEKRMSDIFQHRFTKGAGALAGHSIGNLLLAGFIERAGGDVDTALELASGVLAIRGQVVPSTRDHVRLKATLEDGSEIEGETAIVASGQTIAKLFLVPETASAHPTAIKAIEEADVICIGPGSVFTSVIPNLLIGGMVEALSRSKAKRFYICNVMTQRG